MEPARVAKDTPGTAPRAHMAGLGNGFVSLLARRLPRQQFAVEAARLISQAMHATAIAILSYDLRKDRLSLLASEGLAEDARAALGAGGDCPWDIPMRGLRNRRISVIVGAQQNPFVPRALAALGPRGLSIASLPIYADHEPIGVLLVFAAGNRSFGDSQLHTLSQGLRVCAPGLRDAEAAQARRGNTASPDNVEATIAKLIAAGAIIDQGATGAQDNATFVEPRVLSSTDDIAPAGVVAELNGRVQSLEREQAAAREELEQSARRIRSLTMQNHALGRERDGLLQKLADLEGGESTNTTQLEAEIGALQERLLAVESERSRIHRLSEGRARAAQQSSEALEAERAAMHEQLQNADATVAEQQTLLSAVFDERDRLQAQIDSLSGELRSTQETLQRAQSASTQERLALEADREGWREETTTVRAQLVQRSEQLATIERELRSLTVAHDGACAQLTAARAEIEQLAQNVEELNHSNLQGETARASVAAENSTLRKSLDGERAARSQAESTLRTDLATTRAELEQLSSTTSSLRGELAERVRALLERDEQVTELRRAEEAARNAALAWRETETSLRNEISGLAARLEQGLAEKSQISGERDQLRTAVADLRQRLSQAEVGHASAAAQLQAEAAELKRQTELLNSQRAELLQRLDHTGGQGRDLSRRVVETEHRLANTESTLREREALLAEERRQHETVAAELASLRGQFQASDETARRLTQRLDQERAVFELQRKSLEEQGQSLRSELARSSEAVLNLERETRTLSVSRNAATSELETLQADHGRLVNLVEELRRNLAQVEAEHDAVGTSAATLRQSLETERTSWVDTERALRSELTVVRSEIERLGASSLALRGEIDDRTRQVADREQQIIFLTRELETLRDEGADRGVLAQQATQLGRQVVELERQIAAIRGEATRAARQAAAANQELETARQLYSDLANTLSAERADTQETRQRAVEDRRQIEAEAAALRSDVGALRAAQSELQAAVASAQEERTRAAENEFQAARMLEDLSIELQHALDNRHEQAQLGADAQAEELRRREQELSSTRSQLNEINAAYAEATEKLAKLEGVASRHAAAADEAQRRAAALAEQRASLQAALASAERQRSDREADLTRLHLELDALRQQAANKGVLAEQANQLGSHVVELEQALASARGEASEASRRCATLGEELDSIRGKMGETEGTATRQLGELREAVERLSQERAALESETINKRAELDAQRTSLEDLQRTVEDLHRDQSQSIARGQNLAEQLAEAHHRLEELSARLHEREAAADSAATERGRLSSQVAKLSSQLRSTQEALESKEGRLVLDRSALETERDRWRDQAEAIRGEFDSILTSADAATRDAAELAAARSNMEAEIGSLRRTLDTERQTRAELEASLRSEREQLASEVRGTSELLQQREAALVQMQAEFESLSDAQVRIQAAEAEARTELARLTSSLQESQNDIERLRQERQGIESVLAESQTQRNEAAEGAAAELHAARAQLRALERERATLQSALTEHQQRTRDLASMHASSLSGFEETSGELRRQVASLTALRDQLMDRTERVGEELQQRDRIAEEERQSSIALAERCAQLEQGMTGAEARRRSLEAELVQVRTESERLRAQFSESSQSEEHSSELAKQLSALEQQLAATRGELTRADHQRAALADELASAHALRADLVQAAESEQSRLREKLQQLADERKRVEALQAQQQTDLEAQRAQAADLRGSLEQQREERLHLEQERDELAAQIDEIRGRAADIQKSLRERDEALAAARSEREKLEAQLRTQAKADDSENGRAPLAATDGNAHDAVLVIERSNANDEANGAAEAAESADNEAGEISVTVDAVRELILMDNGRRGEEAATVLRGAGFEVALSPPGEHAAKDLNGRNVGCVMINLAAGPAGWHALKSLREAPASWDVPILAYLMPPEGQKGGFCFGRADFGFWPMEPSRLITRINALRPKCRRLLAVSHDVDSMGKLREPLAKVNMSTSIVLDGKQAVEFTSIVSPEAAIFHLSPSTNAIARAVASIRAQESTADLPMLLLLDKNPPREDVFFASTVRELLMKGTFQLTNLPAEIARVIS